MYQNVNKDYLKTKDDFSDFFFLVARIFKILLFSNPTFFLEIKNKKTSITTEVERLSTDGEWKSWP